MPMAIAIGDDSFKDRPIYVRVTSIGERRNCWYVIEEKPRAAESTSSSSSSDIDEEDDNDILIECESESDRIRRLSVPDSELQYNSLVVLKSRVYLIGGDVEIQKNKDGTTDETKIGFRHLDLGVGGQWRLNGGKGINDQFGAAAVGHDGLIYSVGIEQYRLFPESHTTEEEDGGSGNICFDVERRQWLPRAVEGLRTDGTVLPRAYRTKPEWFHIDDYMGPGFSPFLFQIGNKHNDHKLALLWGSRGTRPKSVVPHCLMIWSKFILHMHASPETTTADDQIPHFSARSLSRGICPLDDSTYELLNCAPGM
ncbi:hypothetical protein M0R45_003113 [Rubus argutus]|uniref:Uncharacterized protein n=1 Tax=Rubus argutus TaxID=59490 RepID=A0AAW1YH11_RUBAR